MKVAEIGNVVGLNGYPLNSTTIEKYKRICRDIQNRHGKIDIKTIDDDETIEPGLKKEMIAAAFAHLAGLSTQPVTDIDALREFAKQCSAKYTKVDFLSIPTKRKNAGKIIAVEEMKRIYLGEFDRYTKYGGYENAVSMMFAAAYGIQPPLRIAEYHHAIVVFDDAELAKFTAAASEMELDAYITQKNVDSNSERQYFNILDVGKNQFTININKTSKRSGQKIIPLVPEFVAALKAWRHEFDVKFCGDPESSRNFQKIPWMCIAPSGKKITDSALTQKITKLFGVPPTALRHSAVDAAETENRRNCSTNIKDVRRDLAKMMLHSVEISELYYNRNRRIGGHSDNAGAGNT